MGSVKLFWLRSPEAKPICLAATDLFLFEAFSLLVFILEVNIIVCTPLFNLVGCQHRLGLSHLLRELVKPLLTSLYLYMAQVLLALLAL